MVERRTSLTWRKRSVAIKTDDNHLPSSFCAYIPVFKMSMLKIFVPRFSPIAQYSQTNSTNSCSLTQWCSWPRMTICIYLGDISPRVQVSVESMRVPRQPLQPHRSVSTPLLLHTHLLYTPTTMCSSHFHRQL